LGVGKAPEGIMVKNWTNPVTIKRALTALGRIGNENALTPLDNFIEPMHKRDKEGLLNDQEKRLLEAAR
jgi:hypothetical protein